MDVEDFIRRWSEAEARRQHPAVFQHLMQTVKPERARNKRSLYRRNWWVFGEPRRELRQALQGMTRYIVTVETAKHRWFRFLDADILPDNKLVVVASDDPAVLGVLSSRVHQIWFQAHAGRIGVYDEDAVYVKGRCFDTFPFPHLSRTQRSEIGGLAEEIDALRQQLLSRHGALTMTRLYNARAELSKASTKDGEGARQGCVGLLDHLHRRLDAAVLAAYGWPCDLGADQMVQRLSQLNRQRQEEEAEGLVRFLRPEYQEGRVIDRARPQPGIPETVQTQDRPDLPQSAGATVRLLLQTLRREGVPLGPDDLAARFSGQPRRRIEVRISQTLAILAMAGAVHSVEDGWFTPRRPSV